MEKVAFIINGTFIYWSSMITILAVVAAVAGFCALYLMRWGRVKSLLAALPLAILLSLFLSRLIHWYCRTDAYDSFASAMTDLSAGGFALAGVFMGCALTILLLRLVGLEREPFRMMDCMTLAGGAAIAVGRLASLFNVSDRGPVMPEDWGLPFGSVLTNAFTGAQEVRLATFMLQAMVVAVIVAALAGYLLWGRKNVIRDGEVSLLFLAFYGGTQIMFDSTRYDSLFLRSNGFVSLVQILSLAVFLTVVIIYSVRMVRSDGLKAYHFALWLGWLASLGLVGYMEYYVQRHGNEALFAYSLMSCGILLALAVTVLIRHLGIKVSIDKALAEDVY